MVMRRWKHGPWSFGSKIQGIFKELSRFICLPFILYGKLDKTSDHRVAKAQFVFGSMAVGVKQTIER